MPLTDMFMLQEMSIYNYWDCQFSPGPAEHVLNPWLVGHFVLLAFHPWSSSNSSSKEAVALILTP